MKCDVQLLLGFCHRSGRTATNIPSCRLCTYIIVKQDRTCMLALCVILLDEVLPVILINCLSCLSINIADGHVSACAHQLSASPARKIRSRKPCPLLSLLTAIRLMRWTRRTLIRSLIIKPYESQRGSARAMVASWRRRTYAGCSRVEASEAPRGLKERLVFVAWA